MKRNHDRNESDSLLGKIIAFCLQQRLVICVMFLLLLGAGVYTAPFDWTIPSISRNPVPLDIIPDIGDNRQIVIADWAGHSAKDVEEEISRPLSSALMGLPGVKTVRPVAFSGYASFDIIFDDKIDYYWSRSRILEKLNSLPPDMLPDGVRPRLGPDATARGMVFWYTLEGSGLSLAELRAVQDSTVRFALLSVKGVCDVASIGGSTSRSGFIDKQGAETVGGAVILRYGENPLPVVAAVRQKIKELSGGALGPVKIVPFYDRTVAIQETLEMLSLPSWGGIFLVVIVILLLLRNFRMALLITATFPAAVLPAFLLLRLFGIEADLVALSGLVIAIGTIVDMGLSVGENAIEHLEKRSVLDSRGGAIYAASCELSSSLITSFAIVAVSLLPILSLQAAEGKLFRPSAFTLIFALTGALVMALTVIPVVTSFVYREIRPQVSAKWRILLGLLVFAVILSFNRPAGIVTALLLLLFLVLTRLPKRFLTVLKRTGYVLVIIVFFIALAFFWRPLGPEYGISLNLLIMVLSVAVLVSAGLLIQHYYATILAYCLLHKWLFLSLPCLTLALGLFCGLRMAHEFMPSPDDGMLCFSVSNVTPDTLRRQDQAIAALPEISSVVGRGGRAETPLDLTAMSTGEIMVNYHPCYLTDAAGRLLRFKYDARQIDFWRDVAGNKVAAADGLPYLVCGAFIRDAHGKLISDRVGQVFGLWRPALEPKLNPGRDAWKGIRNTDDIRQEVVNAAMIPGIPSTLKLKSLEERLCGAREMDGLRLMVVIPLTLLFILLLLLMRFKSVSIGLMIYSGIAVAWSGGFILLWLYGQPWFMNITLDGINIRELLNVHPISLSGVVWFGFVALLGIAANDGIVMATYIGLSLHDRELRSIEAVRQTVITAGLRRIRPCLMITAVTVSALLPVLSSDGRGADIMDAMTIPVLGGMLIQIMTMLVVPVLYCMYMEHRLPADKPERRN